MGADSAGIVEQAAADGSGPETGTAVVCAGVGGGWAELRAVSTAAMLAEAPPGGDLGELCTIPVAGLSALRGLARIGSLLGKRVLVTGASGGVGRFAVQLAHLAGAEVVASTRSPEQQEAELHRLGAAEVVGDPAAVTGLVDGVLDQVGGRQLVDAYRKLAPHGTVVAVGHSSDEGETFAFGDLFGDANCHDRSFVSFYLGSCTNLQSDLAWLAREVVRGRVSADIAWRGDWTRADEAFAALLERRLHGKAVIDIT